jgi:hypothetical protein
MSKKIKFYSTATQYEVPVPRPAYKMIPEWFRKLPGVIDKMETIKKCVPFLDTLTSGYILVLSADILVDDLGIQQISKIKMVESHNKEQLDGLQIPEEYNSIPFKWINLFTTKTPKGYSTMFMHPINRIDLPFYTLTGIVDTDAHPVPVNFPFFIKKDFRGIIPAGTPIAQAFPFKRENWESAIETKRELKIPAWWFNHMNPPFNLYKRMSWKKKSYK